MRTSVTNRLTSITHISTFKFYWAFVSVVFIVCKIQTENNTWSELQYIESISVWGQGNLLYYRKSHTMKIYIYCIKELTETLTGLIHIVTSSSSSAVATNSLHEFNVRHAPPVTRLHVKRAVWNRQDTLICTRPHCPSTSAHWQSSVRVTTQSPAWPLQQGLCAHNFTTSYCTQELLIEE